MSRKDRTRPRRLLEVSYRPKREDEEALLADEDASNKSADYPHLEPKIRIFPDTIGQVEELTPGVPEVSAVEDGIKEAVSRSADMSFSQSGAAVEPLGGTHGLSEDLISLDPDEELHTLTDKAESGKGPLLPQSPKKKAAPRVQISREERLIKQLRWASTLLIGLIIVVLFIASYRYFLQMTAPPKTSFDYQLRFWLQAQERNPSDPQPPARIGELYLNKGDADNAISNLARSLRISKNYVAALYYMGMAYEEQKNPTEALKYYDLALKNNKNKQRGTLIGYRMANLLVKVNKRDRAIKLLESMVAVDPLFWNPHYKLGQLYDGKKDKVNALLHYEQAAAFNPDHVGLKKAIERLKAAPKSVQKAQQDQEKEQE